MNIPEALRGRIAESVPLAPLTTIGIGGPARYFLRAESAEQIESALEWARHESIPLFILGGGSNLLISDEGFPGLVMQVGLRGLTVESEDGFVMLKAAAGEPWDPFVAFAVGRGYAGVECLSGIPGSIGATPIQNVGAYGQEVSETIARVEAIERATGRVRWFTNAECGFAYRDSVFKREAKDRYVILSVSFRLVPGGAAAVRYPELERELDGKTTLAAARQAALEVRRRKGMVFDPADPDTRSDGSFFMNPIVDAARLERIRTPEMPVFPMPDGRMKLSAAWLIERSGFRRGFTRGNVGLSSKHILAIVNRGGATAREALELVRIIQDAVKDRWGVELRPEPNFVGFGDGD
jgi:UDP-N-acetylmuramate dehydrogenase